MKIFSPLLFTLAIGLVAPQAVFAQAFGEYGRMLGGMPQGQGVTGPRTSGGGSPVGPGNGAVGEVKGKAMPTRLVVASKVAGLYPRQDDEVEKLDQLQEGDALVPMVQSSGGNDWFMVKTQKGIVGWIKGVDVREVKLK